MPLKRFSWQRRPHSFLFWLLAVQLLAVLPLMAFASWAVYQLGRSNQADDLADLERRVAASADAVAREADRMKTRLQLLAAQPAARTADLRTMRRLSEQLLAMDGSIAGVSALDRSGQLLFTTRRPEGSGLPRLQPLPADARQVVGTGTPQVGGLATGIDGTLEIGFAAPWRVDGAEAPHVLAMSLKPAGLGDILREQRWPASWTAALLDQDMVIVARSRDEAKHVGKPATESLQRLVREGRRSASFSSTKDGVKVVTAIAPVNGTPWWVVAGVPRQALAEEVSGPFSSFVLGGGALALAGLAASAWLGRYLDRQIKRATLGSGGTPSAVAEFSALGAQQLMLHNDLVGMVRLVDRRSVWHNPALERIFGYAPGELEGHSPRWMHLDDESFAAFGARAYSSISAGERFRDRLRMRRKDGSTVWVDVSGFGLPDRSTLWMLLDVTAAQLEHERVAALAFRDPLTGLPNRALFDDRFQQALAAARRAPQRIAVAMIDLNGFKAVNDQLGHAAGDELLRTTAQRLCACVRANDTVARLGGDEFVLLLPQLAGPAEAEAVIARVREALQEPVVVQGRHCRVSAAIGVAYAPDDGQDAAGLLALADTRMYGDKAASRSAAGLHEHQQGYRHGHGHGHGAPRATAPPAAGPA